MRTTMLTSVAHGVLRSVTETSAAADGSEENKSLLTLAEAQAMVLSGDIKPDLYFGAFEMEHKRKPRLTVDQFLERVFCVAEDDMEMTEWVAEMLEAEDAETAADEPGGKVEDDETKASNYVYAVETAHKFTAEIVSMFNEAADANESYRAAPILLYGKMRKQFTNAEGECAMDAWPVPDSTAKDVAGTNKRADIYEVRSYSGDSRKPKKRSFYGNLAEMLFASLVSERERVNKVKANEAGFDKDLRERYSDAQIDGLKRRLDNRFNVQKNMLKRIANLNHQLAKIDNLAGVEWKFMTEDDGSLINTPKPIVLSPTGKPEKFQCYSIGSILNMDPDKAAKQGGTLTALTRTLEGEPDPHKNEPLIKTAEQFIGATVDIHLALVGPNAATFKKTVLDLVSSQSKEADDMVLTIDTVYTWLDELQAHTRKRAIALRKMKAGQVKAPAN